LSLIGCFFGWICGFARSRAEARRNADQQG
jgi:hypothetical protein